MSPSLSPSPAPSPSLAPRPRPTSSPAPVLLLALCLAGCWRDPPPPSPEPAAPVVASFGLSPDEAARVVAVVGERTITLGEFAEELSREASFARQEHSMPEGRASYLDGMVREELLAAEARRRGMASDPDVVRARQAALAALLLERWRGDGTLPAVSDLEVRQWYDAHRAELRSPERSRVRFMLVHERDEAEAVLAQLLAAPMDDGLFRRLATEHVWQTPMVTSSGDTGWFPRPAERTADDPDVPPELVEVAWSMSEVNTYHPTPIAASGGGFYIARLIGREPATERSFEESAGLVRARLEAAALERAIADALAQREQHVEIDREALDAIEIPE